MTRQTKVEREREAERQQLATDLDAHGMTSDLRGRLARWAADGIVRTWTYRGKDARRDQALGRMLADLYRDSGIDDAEPGSMTVMPGGSGDVAVSVVSRSQGRVSIGVLPSSDIARAIDAEPLDATEAARAATETLRARTERRVRRTADLVAASLTSEEIGRQIAIDEGRTMANGEPWPFPPGTVRDWRRRARKL